jgi:GT2 family glycosyltransferase
MNPDTARQLSETLSGCLDVQAPVAVRAIDVEVGLELAQLPPSRSGKPYQHLAVLLRRGGWPLGWASVPVSADGNVSPEALAMLADAAPTGTQTVDDRPAMRAGDIELDCSANGNTRAAGALLTVVVATCANDESVVRCVEEIRASSAGPFEVIVVENRPAHSTVRQTLAERFPDDQRIRCVTESRPGLAPARNAGLAAASGEIVAFTDDDVVVDSAWIAAIRAAFDAQPDVACVTGLILPFELETSAQLLVEQFASFGKGFAARVYSLDDPPVDQPMFPYTAGYFGSGANMAFRTDVIRRMGGFDPVLGTGTRARGGEDLDICIRLLHAGHTLAYDPRSIVWHRHPDSADGLRRRAFDYGVGLGAMLSKQMLTGPNRWRMLSLVPQGLRYFVDPRSRKNALRSAIFPRKLSLLEQAGLLYGPVAYLTSRMKAYR